MINKFKFDDYLGYFYYKGVWLSNILWIMSSTSSETNLYLIKVCMVISIILLDYYF